MHKTNQKKKKNQTHKSYEKETFDVSTNQNARQNILLKTHSF
jgi:hypothetical protein